MAMLCNGVLSPTDFPGFVEGHTWPDDALLMAFTPAEERFERFRQDADFFNRTDQGRIFSPDGELHWRRMDQGIRAVYLGNHPPQHLEDCSSELEGLSPCRRTLFLWGVRTETDNEWLEQQVPHRFSYPVASAEFSRGRVGLIVEDWKDHSKIPRFSRYHSIIEVKGGK